MSVRFALREATHLIHERLHGLSPFERLLAGGLGRHEYGRLLSRLYGFHKPIEDALLSFRWRDAAELGWRGLARVHRLEADLQHLGLEPGGVPRMALPAINAPAGMLGMLYVREGAALGGRVLARKLDGLFGDDRRGRTFLAGEPGDVACWQATCAVLERHAGDLPEIIAAAHATFAAFETWFESWIETGDAGPAPRGFS